MEKDKSYGHRDDTTTVSFWIQKNILEKWTKFSKNRGISRSNLIKNAVEEFILKHEMDDKMSIQIAAAKADQREVVEKLESVLQQIAELKKDDTQINDPNMQGWILEFLQEKPFTDKKLAKLMQMDRDNLLDILAIMKKQGLVRVRINTNQEGEWYI